MHLRRKYRMANSIEVVEFNSPKCPGKSKPRREKKNPTPEAVAKNNQRRKQRECSRMVERYFNEDDGALTLTWAKEKRPKTMKEALAIFRKLVVFLKREYAKRYYELFWIRNIEVGPRGAWHIHMIVNRIEGMEFLINDWWTANCGAPGQGHRRVHLKICSHNCGSGGFVMGTLPECKKSRAGRNQDLRTPDDRPASRAEGLVSG